MESMIPGTANATVIVLTGPSGPDKSHRMNRLREKIACSLHVFTPGERGDRLDATTVNWSHVDAIVVNNLFMFDEESVRIAVPALEATAIDAGRRLVLVTPARDDLARVGVTLQTEPLVLELGGVHELADTADATQCRTCRGTTSATTI